VSSITPRTPVKIIWNKIRAIERSLSFYIPSSIFTDETLITDLFKISNYFAEFFAQASSDNSLTSETLYTKQNSYCNYSRADFNSSNIECYNKPITLQELKNSIKNTKPATVGPDNFHINMLKLASEGILIELLQLLNKIWSTGTIPKCWKEATIIPVLKSNKNPTQLDSYQPISLTLVLCKVMERIVNGRLQYKLEIRKLLTPSQCDFRSGRSTLE